MGDFYLDYFCWDLATHIAGSEDKVTLALFNSIKKNFLNMLNSGTLKLLYQPIPETTLHMIQIRLSQLSREELLGLFICKNCGKEFGRSRYSPTKKPKYCSKECWMKVYTQTQEFKDSVKRAQQKIKYEVFSHYSNGEPKCACCGENIMGFLTIDHINNDGNEERRKLSGKNVGGSGGIRFYSYLKQQGYPNGYQVLCFNCNSGRAYNGGVCPHKTQHLNNSNIVIITKDDNHATL